MSQIIFSRRHLFAGSAGLAALAVAAAPAPRAFADGFGRYDTVAAYEKAWAQSDASVGDNEGGGLAWGTSYVLLSLVRMYQATGDDRYLDRFVELAEQVWALTDQRRGVRDWDGRSGWVWRSGGNYVAAGAVVEDGSGTPLFEVRYAGADGVAGEVAVKNVGPGTADLTLSHPSGTYDVPGVSLDPTSPDFVVTRVNEDVYHPWYRWTAKRLDGPASAVPDTGESPLQQRYYAFAAHTGMITYPMALFARVVLEEGKPRYRGSAQQYLAWTQKSVEFHDAEWQQRELPDGSTGGDYVWPKGAPVPFDGLIQPFNQTHALGQTMAELHRTGRVPDVGEKVTAMISSFRADVEVDGDAWQWRYWPTYSELLRGYSADEQISEYTPWYTPATQYEDISHASITIELLVSAHHAGLGSTENDIAHLVSTYSDNVALGADSVATRVNGGDLASQSIAAQAGRWLQLQPFAPWMADHVHAVYEAYDLDPSGGSQLLGVSNLVWARQVEGAA